VSRDLRFPRMQYAREIEVSMPADQAFAYLADFTNAAEWDPGVVELGG
jgi:carbon monoxide dehydrogenase subunit G